MPDLPIDLTRPLTWAALRRANRAAGHYFFEPSSMAFFDSRLEGSPLAGGVFVTSEQFHGSDGTHDPRAYTVRMMGPDGVMVVGRTGTCLEFQKFATLEDAMREARLLAHATLESLRSTA